ncbi:MAG: glutamine amidotransferase [Cyanobacteria bacterium P01_A01_bin.105]
MPQTILVIFHQETSRSGLVGDQLTAQGYQIEQRCPALGDPLPEILTPYAGVIVFGGPASANDTAPHIQKERDWLPTVLAAQIPYLGICLGAQLLAKALGATVAPHPTALQEIGYEPIEATASGRALFPEKMWVYHFHNEGFELPAGAELLATGQRFPNQAFRYGPYAYAVQFHPEITLSMMEFWTTQAADYLKLPGAQPREQHFQDHAEHGETVAAWLDQFLTHWLSTRWGQTGKRQKAKGERQN